MFAGKHSAHIREFGGSILPLAEPRAQARPARSDSARSPSCITRQHEIFLVRLEFARRPSQNQARLYARDSHPGEQQAGEASRSRLAVAL